MTERVMVDVKAASQQFCRRLRRELHPRMLCRPREKWTPGSQLALAGAPDNQIAPGTSNLDLPLL